MFSKLFISIAPYITPVIWLFGLGNIVIFIIARSKINSLSGLVHSWGFYDFHGDGSTDVKELIETSDCAARWYALYANLTAIFPLLGIFGTVCSLLNLSDLEDMSTSFSIALDTTVWGLIFAMGFKLADSAISSKLDRALDEADYQIHKLNQEMRKSYAPQEET